MQIITSSQASPEVLVNENFETLQWAEVYGKDPNTTSGLTWGYNGGRWSGISITSGSLSLTASSACYIVVLRSTGVISFSTDITNWNNQLDYARVYSVVTGTSTITSFIDYRSGTGGVHGPAVGMYQFAQLLNIQIGTTYTILSTDYSKLITVNNAASVAVTLPIASSFSSVFWFEIQNTGIGTVTITPTTSTIDGATSLSLATGQGLKVVSNGTNYYTLRGMGNSGGGSGAGTTVSATAPISPVNGQGWLDTNTGISYTWVDDGVGAGQWVEAAAAGGMAAGRELLKANRTYYVSTTGSDSNNGLSVGSPFLTIQRAVDVVCASLDFGNFYVTIQIADGTYTGSTLCKKYISNAGTINIVGNETTPSNVLISTTSNSCFTGELDSGRYLLSGMKFQTTTAGAAIRAAAGSSIVYKLCNFGATAWAHIYALQGGTVICAGNYTISGGGFGHWFTENDGFIQCVGYTITITGAPTFSQSFISTDRGLGLFEVYGNTFSGSATGKRYKVENNSVVFTNAAGATHLPGNVAGTTANGGLYL